MDEFCYDYENESGNNDVMGTVVTEDKAKASTYESSPTAIVVCEDGKMTVNVFSGSTYSARNKNVDTDESCYIFGWYLSDETVNVENVHVSETNSKVGNTVACSDMSGSLSGSLSGKVVTVRGHLDQPPALRTVRSEHGRNDARQGEAGGALEAQGRAGRRPAASRCEPRSSRRPSRREYGVEVERQTAVCAQGNATQQRKGTQPNKARERNPTAKRGNETQEQSKGTKPKNKTRERDPKTEGAPTRRTEGAPTQRPETATTSQGPSEETTGRRSPSSGPTLEKWGDVWTSRLNRG